MVQKKGILIAVVAFLLGALAMAFSFIAFAKRIKVKDVIVKDGYCVYPSSPSPVLGIMAALFLFAEHIVISAATSCFCCCGIRCSSRCTYITSLVFFILSWVSFVIAFPGLIFISILYTNFLSKSFAGKNVGDCNVVNEHSYLGSAFWCIITTVLGLISYAFWVCGAANTNNHLQGRTIDQEQGVAMGEPRLQQPPKDQSSSST